MYEFMPKECPTVSNIPKEISLHIITVYCFLTHIFTLSPKLLIENESSCLKPKTDNPMALSVTYLKSPKHISVERQQENRESRKLAIPKG